MRLCRFGAQPGEREREGVNAVCFRSRPRLSCQRERDQTKQEPSGDSASQVTLAEHQRCGYENTPSIYEPKICQTSRQHTRSKFYPNKKAIHSVSQPARCLKEHFTHREGKSFISRQISFICCISS